MVQETDVVGTIDLEQAVVESAEGLDEEAHKALITQVALAYNELLPNVPLWERYGNNPALDGVRVTGWPRMTIRTIPTAPTPTPSPPSSSSKASYAGV